MPRIITLTPNPALDYAVQADFVEPNRKLRCRDPQTHPGGGGINVARAVSRLGGETLAIFTTAGIYGDALVRVVAAEKVPMLTVPVSGETRLAFHITERAQGNEYRFNLPGAQLSAADAKNLLDAVRDNAKPGGYVVGSGSLPPGAPADFWAQAARAAKDKGALFVLDSISGVREAISEGIYMLRQNKHEYQELAGRDLHWPDEITEYAKATVGEGGVERMIVTHGGDGSVMASKNGAVRVGALKVKAHSAVGAGDSFVAALLVGLARGDSDEKALHYGMAAAAATRMTEGTALFDPADVERLYQTTQT